MVSSKKAYEIWLLQCHSNSKVPKSQIEGKSIDFQEENSSFRQESLKSIEAENIETGDITQTQNIYHQFPSEDKFAKLSYEQLTSVYDFPQLNTDINTVIDKLNNENRLLVIGGRHDDKRDLALYVAINFFENRTQSDIQNAKLFVIDRLEPHHLTRDLQEFQNSANIGNNFIIATTEIPQNIWIQASDRIWWEPKQEGLYEKHSLTTFLLKSLKPETQSKLQDLLGKKSEKTYSENRTAIDSNEVHDFFYQQVTQKGLETLYSIRACARELDELNDDFSLSNLEESFKSAKNPKESLEKWYKGCLNYREQLLAIAISLFDGLFEDQFFAALEEIVENVWQQRYSSLQAFDYRDLENFKNHCKFIEMTVYSNKLKNFKFVKTKDYAMEFQIQQLKLQYAEDRRALFEIVWDSDRRQILTTLQVIQRLILDSTKNNTYNTELYGGWIRGQNFRNVISKTLSDLGIVSRNTSGSVQEALLLFAGKPEITIQNVTAEAIAGWYQQGFKEEFYSIVQQFYNFTIQTEEIETKNEKRDDSFNKNLGLISLFKNLPFSFKKLPMIGFLISLFAQPRVSEYSFAIHRQQDYIGSEQWTTGWPEKIIFHNCSDIATSAILQASIYREQLSRSENSDQSIYTDCFGATVALSLSLIISQNKTFLEDKEFCNWLDELSESRFPIVHLYFGYNTLFSLVPKHLNSLSSWLKKTAQKHTDFLNHAIALSLAQAYLHSQENRDLVKQILSEWFDECSRNRQKLWKENDKYDALLKTTILAYGLIEYDSLDKQNFLPKQVIKYLNDFTKNETKKLVRDAAVSAFYILIYRYFSEIEEQSKRVIANLTNNENDFLVRVVTSIYLEERANLQGGDDEVFIQGNYYQVWLDSDRRSEHLTVVIKSNASFGFPRPPWKNFDVPKSLNFITTHLTAVEEVLFRWIQRTGNKLDKNSQAAAQRFALRAFANFANEFEQEEEIKIQELKEERNHAKTK